MGDHTPRTYMPSARYRRVESVRRKHRGCAGLLLVPLFLIALVAYAFWTTRDTYSVARLIPKDQRFRVFAGEVLNKRGKIAASRVWQALPESWGLEGMSAALNRDLHLPEWVLNNIVGPVCYISGNDLNGFSDVLFVTKMRRIGCLVERFHWLGSAIEEDHAGGLELRSVKELNAFYAVRGRVLLVSLSRTALIHALTLREEEALDAQTLSASAEVFGAEDVHGTVSFDGLPPAQGEPAAACLGAQARDVLTSASFAVRVEPESLHIKCRGALSPAWAGRLSTLIEGASPRKLEAPPAGLAGLSADLGKPLRAVWADINQALAAPIAWEDLRAKWAPRANKKEDALDLVPAVLELLASSAGTGIRVSWYGADLNDIVPIPEFVATLDMAPETVDTFFQSLPPPGDAKPWESRPFYDPEKRQVHVPMPCGPALEPTFAPFNGGLLISTSARASGELLSAAPGKRPLEDPGNLYCVVKPYACVKTVHDAAALLAENGLLKDYTSDSLDTAFGPWLDHTRRIEEVSVLLAKEEGELTAKLTLICAPQP